jgi:hypothetical protein
MAYEHSHSQRELNDQRTEEPEVQSELPTPTGPATMEADETPDCEVAVA